MWMSSKKSLYRVEPVPAVNINSTVLLIGSIAIMILLMVLFNLMMEDINLLMIKSI